MSNKPSEKVLKNIAVPFLIGSSFFFGVVANIISDYQGSYLYEMMNGGVSGFLITFTPILLTFIAGGYLLYNLNRGSN